ncbi:MAG: DegT/DnrJ/EryC1/StrS family aminotransferase [Elusimicrobia bacterium]|nr:DegT/DnrJ/EryC1/StrS family aminotransferase [Elusimicrobiota bacterium]
MDQKIPIIDLKAELDPLDSEIKAALQQVLDDKKFILGPAVQRFEKDFAAYLGVRHCVAVHSGTTALWMALTALGLEPGDEVLTTPFTFFGTLEAILWAGGKPVLVDIDPETLNIDPQKLEAALSPKTRGILPVHLYGQPADMDPIMKTAKSNNLWVLEDACQAHGSTYRGRRAGALGSAAAFSFYPTKNLGALGDAGAIVTQDDDLAGRLRLLRSHGEAGHYHHVLLGTNARLDSFQAALLSVKLRRLEQRNEARRRNARKYAERLKNVPGLRCVRQIPEAQSNYHQFIVRHAGRDALKEFLDKKGVATAVHYPCPAHQQPVAKPLGLDGGSFPAAEKAAREVLALPVFRSFKTARFNTSATASSNSAIYAPASRFHKNQIPYRTHEE